MGGAIVFGYPLTFCLKVYFRFQKLGVNKMKIAKNSKRPRSIWMLLNHFRTSGKEDIL